MDAEGERNLVLAVNGQRFEVHTIDPSTTLLHFLRSRTPFKSVKLGCGEGGCGACVVLLSKYNPVIDQVEEFTINSCLTLVCTINRCSITTSEGLGNTKNGFHPIHKRLAGFHASQCGFCSPGMCVSLYGALTNAQNTNTSPGCSASTFTVSQAEKAIAGNLCRCTGYRPIIDTCKSFAADVDMEDLGFNSFWKKGESDEVKRSRLPLYDYKHHHICTFPEYLKKEIKSSMVLDLRRFGWYYPTSLEELRALWKLNQAASLKLVVGNTGMGYFKEVEHYDRYIDMRSISELSIITRNQRGIEIGANVTLSKAIEALKNEHKGSTVPQKIADHMEKIATGFIRNSASVGGNLVMAQRKQFPSDMTTILVAVDTMVNIANSKSHEKLSLEEFLERPPLESHSVVLSVEIPYLLPPFGNNSSIKNSNFLFETYRAAPRPLGNALPYLNAAFAAHVSPCTSSDGYVVSRCRLAFGAYGTKHTVRARNVEEFLTDKLLSHDVLYEAIELLKGTIVPDAGTSWPAYRSSLAAGFIFEFLSPFTGESRKLKDNSAECSYEEFNKLKSLALISSEQQIFELSDECKPVGDPLPKYLAPIQASGEAVYVDDIPSPKYCLHGAFIYSPKPLARVKSVGFRSKSLPDGVSAIISFKDIPESGENIGAETFFGKEPLFAEERTECVGQAVALVVADTQKHADLGASLAVIEYDTENLESPILSLEEAVKRCSFFEVPSFISPKQVGDISKGMAEADHKILSTNIRLGSQYYFYMETQTALAVPDEDNCMVVYSSSQCPRQAQCVIAKCLGVPQHNVRVITRRVGGGFGGKAMKAMPTATACALAAQNLGRPVRMYLNRKTDMIMAGGRHPMKITYSVGFKTTGKITGLHVEILIDAGAFVDLSPMLPLNVVNGLKKYDWGALSFDIKVCKTNLPSRSAVRAPGEVQGSFIAEAVIEHVASTLSMEVDSVRKTNLHTCNSLMLFFEGETREYTLPSIMDTLAISSSFDERTVAIKEFNRCNIWHKRGISRVPVVYEVTQMVTPGKVSILSDGSIVVEVGGIEIGQGLWTKVKQMAAYVLSLIKCDGSENLFEKVRVIQMDTLSLIQGGVTSGSTTSESSCEAIRICCNILVQRLTPLKKNLDSIKWEMLVSRAYATSVNLSVNSLYVPELSCMKYINYGAAVSEVEINVVTGETTILRTDMIYDCGQSLNPAVDLGQIEGAFVQGIGFFMLEEYVTNDEGLVVTDSTWNYKIPTIDNIPRQFNVQLLNSGGHQKRLLSSKASGEPPLLLAASVHCATRAAIVEARRQVRSWTNEDGIGLPFQLEVPAIMPVVKELCGLDIVERYLKWKLSTSE